MTSQDKRCGTCKWWRLMENMRVRGSDGIYQPAGACSGPIPSSVEVEDLSAMGSLWGQTCPTWQPKEPT